ncbi:DUF2301 domain-containing membrane protein [Prochlorococcus marinus]|uniref:DUF2301 domain-containing membrane protein n=1 Tax=Prochlorococcus marinus XMU1408 TaxID=2213228 RepID=A0A318R7Z9_PROMR|nr:DUF2301 domain-containing membrane protein [Prochlorococcus marinus]MBW3041283.1 hypothetical protein [Prochlorococcus marinus str. XMU1408]PYE03871.1 hypothetical protein DNJ73_01435 [Prochlorococcus marinus XMU1408]
MNEENSYFKSSNPIKGVYGDYIVTPKDKREVLFYRLSILFCGLFFSLGLFQWFTNGSSQVWISFAGLGISLGLSLKWIHIYLRPLHQTLVLFWATGCIGLVIVTYHFGLTNLISSLKENPKLVFLVGPLFVSLTGIGFKEFFCFRRTEAIGITIFIPIAFIGHLTELISEKFTFSLLVLSSLLLLVLGIRKFNLPAEADIGDKSVFDFLERQRKLNTPDIKTN